MNPPQSPTESKVQLLTLFLAVIVHLSEGAQETCPTTFLQKEASYNRRLSMNNALFLQDVLMEVPARSRSECSKKCVETDGCVMWTSHPSSEGPPDHCRLFRQIQDAMNDLETAPGAESFALSASPSPPCSRDYELKCGRCLSLPADKKDYYGAKQHCDQIDSGKLMMLRTEADLLCAWDYMRGKDVSYAWLGADDQQNAGQFRWGDGTALLDNSPLWKSGDPEKKNPGSDCVYLDKPAPEIRTYLCSDPDNFLCQKTAYDLSKSKISVIIP